MKRWIEPQPVEVPDVFQLFVGGHPLIAEQLIRRGITTVDEAQAFLDANRYTPASPDELPDMDKAVERLQRAIDQQERILVWGDFDVDGQTATSLLVSALRELGADVRYHIPNRFKEGHGIHLPTLKTLLTEHDIDLMLTCDTGVSAHESVHYAMDQGVDVVVTDHHALPDELPRAVAVVNPMRLPEGHALRELPGVGVAYKVMEKLFGDRPSEHLLDLVALGIVADVMVQVDDTRYLLQRGLNVLRDTDRAGLRALMERAEIVPELVNEGDIGFGIAPRLNSLGRLDDANGSVELLTTSDYQTIENLVNHLEGLNRERRNLSNQVYDGAKDAIERDETLLSLPVLVVAHEGWHTGVVGIVANRLAEEYNRPVILLSINGEMAGGSARSVAGCDITEAIKQTAHLLRRFGGHTMAAGLSLPIANISDFRVQLARVVREMLSEQPITPTLEVDSFITLAEISLDLTADIERLAPFGNGNPPLVLAVRDVEVASRRTLGSRADHLDVKIEDQTGNTQSVKWWRAGIDDLPKGRFDLAFTLRTSYFRGKVEPLLEWIDYRQNEEQIAEITSAGEKNYSVVDLRAEADTLDTSELLKRYPDAVIWAEGVKVEHGIKRTELKPASTLIVWTVPPAPDVWEDALKDVNPRQVVLVGNDPQLDELSRFSARLAGLMKFTLSNKDGQTTLQEIAGAMAHRVEVVKLGLQWLASQGIYTVEFDGDAVNITTGGRAKANLTESLEIRLKAWLSETASYRSYWLQQALD